MHDFFLVFPIVFVRCQELSSEERQHQKKDEKCPFLENSGSEEDVLQILQYMATILGEFVQTVCVSAQYSQHICSCLHYKI